MPIPYRGGRRSSSGERTAVGPAQRRQVDAPAHHDRPKGQHAGDGERGARQVVHPGCWRLLSLPPLQPSTTLRRIARPHRWESRWSGAAPSALQLQQAPLHPLHFPQQGPASQPHVQPQVGESQQQDSVVIGSPENGMVRNLQAWPRLGTPPTRGGHLLPASFHR